MNCSVTLNCGMKESKRPSPFENIFSQLEDTRNPRLTYYPLNEVLFLILVGSLCGCDKLTTITVFGEEKLEWLRNYYTYKNGIPSHDTLGRVLGLVDKKHFESLFVNWVANYFQIPTQTLLQIDGKHISGSANHHDKVKKREDGGNYAEMIINVYASAVGITLAHHNFTDNMSEMKGALEVLEWLNIEGCCISGDSNFCRTKIVDKIIAKKADYLFTLKANTRRLHDAACQSFKNQELIHSTFETHDRAHGREEHRIYRSINIDQVADLPKDYFTKNQQLIEVTRHRHVLRSGKKTVETHYYVTSLASQLQQVAQMIRKHWLIENELHYVLDVYFGEDASRVQQNNAASNLSLIRKMAMNILKRHPTKGAIKAKQLRCAISDQKREEILKFMMR